jgi:hypothetical protein
MKTALSLALLSLSLGLGAARPAAAQGVTDPLAERARVEALCAQAPESADCAFAQARMTALVAALVADAGNTRDRGQFLGAVRAYLDHPSAEIRTAALYALAKLQPDATDTPVILAALFDPVSNVRAGAWAAAAASSDPAALAVIERVLLRPPGGGYGPNPVPFDPASISVPLPDGAEYLWLTAGLRGEGQLQFLTDASPEEVLAHFAPFASGPAVAPEDAYAAHPNTAFLFGDFDQPALYGDPQVLVLPAAADVPARMVVVYRDKNLGRTGFSLVLEFRNPIGSPPAGELALPEPEAEAIPDVPDEVAQAEAWLGVIPGAPEEETTLFRAIMDADGYGAESYLELYPEGAYADRMRAILAGPRMMLDDLGYADTGTITVSFANLPARATASIMLHQVAADHAVVETAFLTDAAAETARIDLAGRHPPGVYLVRAEVFLPDAPDPIYLARDLSIVAVPPVLAIDLAEVAPGAALAVRYSGMPGAGNDYIAIAQAGSAPEAYVSYLYTEGQRDGVAALTAPAKPGEYELRAFFRGETRPARVSLPFTVTDGAAVPANQVTAAPELAVGAKPGAEPGSGATVTAATGVTLGIETAVIGPAETIRLTYSGMSGATQDFVATAPAGSGPEVYLKYVYTNGAREGSATLVAPDREGAYELRAIFASDASTIQATVPFTVRADVRLSLEKTVFAPGETIRIGFSGLAGASKDYLATAAAGSAPGSYIGYVYANGAREGTLTLKAPDQPGAYELRAFLAMDQTVAKASLPFTVAAP